MEEPLPSMNWSLPSQPLRKGSKVSFHPFLMKNKSWQATGCPPHTQALLISLLVAFTSSQLGAGPKGLTEEALSPSSLPLTLLPRTLAKTYCVGFQGPPKFVATSGDP